MMLKSKTLLFLLLLAFSSAARAEYLSWKEIEKRFQAENLNTKALGHIQCFFEKHENSVFQKKLSYDALNGSRCSGDSQSTLDSRRIFALIDYTAPSDQRRMFLVDRKTGGISMMAVAHGRYEANMFNTKLRKNKNSVKHARYFSNEFNSNAPSSGFYLAGGEYEGKFGRSMILHGLEEGINDNACERAVVVHKHLMVTKSSAHAMSSGCPMVSRDYIDHVINLLKAPVDRESEREASGSVVFIYGPREARWSAASCEGNFNIL